MSASHLPRDARRLRIVRDEFLWTPDWSLVKERAWTDRVRRIKEAKNLSTELLVKGSKIENAQRAFYRSRKNHETRFLPTQFEVKQFALYPFDRARPSRRREDVRSHRARNFSSFFTALWQLGRPLKERFVGDTVHEILGSLRA